MQVTDGRISSVSAEYLQHDEGPGARREEQWEDTVGWGGGGQTDRQRGEKKGVKSQKKKMIDHPYLVRLNHSKTKAAHIGAQAVCTRAAYSQTFNQLIKYSYGRLCVFRLKAF